MKLASSSYRVIPSRADKASPARTEGTRDRRLIIQTGLSDTRLFVRALACARDDKSRITTSNNPIVNDSKSCP
jgi:hypothetical protein